MLFHDEAALAPGAVVGSKLIVERLLGAGGMGIVYAATHNSLQSRVAIKVLRPSVAQRHHAIERFVREARVSAQLSSPHTVRVHDIGELESGLPYMIMEFLDGRDLGALLAAEGPIEAFRLVPLILDACEALAEAHALGFVHRDLKPANLFLARTAGGHEVLKVLDFGIAKALVESDTPSWLTTSNAVLGSAAYMSPEQLIASRDVDPQTDIWALGVVLFQLLTGQLPFSAETSGGMGALILHAATPSIRVIHPALSPALDALVSRCLAKKKEHRFASVAELSAALSALSLDRTSSLPPAPRSGESPVGAVTAQEIRSEVASASPAESTQETHSRALTTQETRPELTTSTAPSSLALTTPGNRLDLGLVDQAEPHSLVPLTRAPQKVWRFAAAIGVMGLLLGSRYLDPRASSPPATSASPLATQPASTLPAGPQPATPAAETAGPPATQPAGPQPAGPQPAGPQPAGPQPAGSQAAGPQAAAAAALATGASSVAALSATPQPVTTPSAAPGAAVSDSSQAVAGATGAAALRLAEAKRVRAAASAAAPPVASVAAPPVASAAASADPTVMRDRL